MASRADGFDCPVCFEPLRRPIYQCVNGHLICRERNPKKVCPTCRVELTDQRIRCLEADRRADNPRPSPYTPPPASRAHPLISLPEAAQRSVRRFSTNACPKHRPELNIVLEEDPLVEIMIYKVSDELVGFGAENVTGGATYQIQLYCNTPPVLADFIESFNVYLQARPTFPKSWEDLRSARIKVTTGGARPTLYIAAVFASNTENTVRLLQSFLRSKCRRHVRFLIRTEVQDVRVFEASPPFGTRWIKLRIDSRDSNVTLLFDGDLKIFRERLDAHGVSDIYMSDLRLCRCMKVEASESTERDRALRVIQEVFRGLVMRVCLVEQPTSPYAAAFIAELRRNQCLRFR